jgi:hypothetical protein
VVATESRSASQASQTAGLPAQGRQFTAEFERSIASSRTSVAAAALTAYGSGGAWPHLVELSQIVERGPGRESCPLESVREQQPGWSQASARPRRSEDLRRDHVNGNWLADQLTRLQVRYSGIPIVFADTRRHAEDWTHRFLTTALTDTAEPS